MEEKCIDIFCWLGDNFFDWFNSLITLFVGVMAYKLQKRIHESNEKKLSDSERGNLEYL